MVIIVLQIGDWGFNASGMCLFVFIKVFKKYFPTWSKKLNISTE